jgi:hypothetical protein
MTSPFLVTLLGLVCSAAVVAAPSAEVAALANEIEAPLRASRYMEGNCVPTTQAGWEGYDTRRCSYEVRDKKTAVVKPGLVILLDPPALKLSEWIISACRHVLPSQPLSSCTSRLFARILDQSGGQFAVAGIVYEDLIPNDGVFEAYGFKDGVTALLDGVQHRRTEAFSSKELEAALVAKATSTVSQDAYARIAGVTRDEFRKANPAASVEGLAWLKTVRAEYQKAWKSDRNSLIEAWLAANPS